MKFGVREICDVVFKAKAKTTIGNKDFEAGQPVLYIDTAKTSTIEGAATTVYAQGGKGNTRLIAWEGEKTLTFTVEDALLSPIGFSVLSGAGLFRSNNSASNDVHVHMTTQAQVTTNDGGNHILDLTGAVGDRDICSKAPLFISQCEADGSVTGDIVNAEHVNAKTIEVPSSITAGTTLIVDYYVIADGKDISELQIDAENFAGYYYVEASTLFRREDTGKDLPAEITFPKVKIQSNFTFTMASEGDPSTFTFTMDAFPGYTYFDQTKEVLCVMQVLDDAINKKNDLKTVMPHTTSETQIDVDLTDKAADENDTSYTSAKDSWRGSN